jgi:hypothetical protein
MSSREEVGATPNVIMDEAFIHFLLPEIFYWIRPQDVAHQPVRRGLAESVDLDAQRK